jgi:hypothetical protein
MNDHSSSCTNWTITLRYKTKKLKAIVQKKAITYSPAAAAISFPAVGTRPPYQIQQTRLRQRCIRQLTKKKKEEKETSLRSILVF